MLYLEDHNSPVFTETAQVSAAVQALQMAQQAVDSAQATYDAAINRQAKVASAMSRIEQRLKGLQEEGQAL
jgi:hypothetical protein